TTSTSRGSRARFPSASRPRKTSSATTSAATAAERRRMLRTVRTRLDRSATLRPDGVWLIAPEAGLELTFAELQQASRRLARHLADLGIEPGERVAMLMGNGYQTARLLLGVMYGGWCATPLNLLAQPSQLAYVAQHCDARVVFVAPDQAARLDEALAGAGRQIHVEVCDVDSPSIAADRD